MSITAPATAGELARTVAHLRWTHGVLEKTIADWPAEKRFAQFDGLPNHLTWQLGHLARTYDWLRCCLDGKAPTVNEAWKPVFGGGSKPTADAAAYPPFEQVKAEFDRTFNDFAKAAESMQPELLTAKPALEAGQFADTRFRIITQGAWHDGWHMGQLLGTRKALGMKSIFE
ncbi:MAG TPA: DinB family protein [Phycisphaerales bacterium]|nr:DinB family protein [Phycisphaerales bacterium]